MDACIHVAETSVSSEVTKGDKNILDAAPAI